MTNNRWGDPIYEDHTTTRRHCKKCSLVMVSRHEPDNDPPHWREWERDGVRFQSTKTPACEESTMAKKPDPKPAAEVRLIELRAENFKKLTAVSITPDGSGLFKVAGMNENGKSSVLDAFMAAIGGPKYFPPEPVRRGESESLLQVNLGALVVVRRIWNRDDGGVGQEVVVQFSDGKRPSKPQTVLDELRGSPIADDPVAFARLKPRDRLELLQKLVPGVDFDELAEERRVLFEDRTQVGRDHDRWKGVVESHRLPANPQTTPVDVAALMAEMLAAIGSNDEIDRRAAARDKADDKIAFLMDEADKLVAKANAMQSEARILQARLDDADPLPAKIDVSAIQARIEAADEVNAQVREVQLRDDAVLERDKLSKKYDDLSSEIDAIDERKKAAVAGAKLPVENLGFGEDDITLDGLPFQQASAARRIRVATALLMALKPDIRVLLVREGSLLDDGMREALHEEAVRNKFVVLFETVGDGDGTGVVIRDGEVA